MLPEAPPSADLRPYSGGDAKRLEDLLDRAERLRLRGLPLEELRELVALQRLEAGRLARLRERGNDTDRIRYLNALCVRAHTLLHAQPPLRQGRSSRWAEQAAATIGRTWRAQVFAWLLLAVGVLIGATLTWRDPQAISVFVPAQLGYGAMKIENLAGSHAARADFLTWESSPTEQQALFGTILFAHNTQVGLLSFATGVLAGIPTLVLQLYNGMLLGAFAAIFLGDELIWRFLAWILPHGIPELTAITLCAAGGLLFGEAVAIPGRDGRARSLRRAFPSALMLFAISVPLFVLAAFLESFVRESALSTEARFAVAAGGAALVAVLLTTTRWLGRAQPRQADWLLELIGPGRSELPGSD